MKADKRYKQSFIPGNSDPSLYNSVTRPEHYTNRPVEVIKAMEMVYGKEAVIHFCECNAFKYRMRAGYKGDAAEDIAKALWYDGHAEKLRFGVR